MKLKFRKGLNLSIKGGVPTGAAVSSAHVECAAVCPDDFPGFMPKVAVKEGDAVAVGTPLLYDKRHPEVKLVSPLKGRVKAVVRGERRKIERVVVEASDSVEVPSPKFSEISDAASVRKALAESGLLAFMRQRPYDIVPNPDEEVRDIFVTALDTAPLAYPLTASGASLFEMADYESGVAALSKITIGKVYICHGGDLADRPVAGAEMVEVEGPHPSGNVSVQIAVIRPVDKGDVVWTLDFVTLGRIGRMMRTGFFSPATVVAVVGPEVVLPGLVKTVVGAPVSSVMADRIAHDGRHHRVIAGNVFTGTAVDGSTGFLHYPYRQITVIAEGDDVDEFMGLASFAPKKMSESRSFPGHFIKRLFAPDARLNGGRRAMIMSGEYDKTLPMDILPEYLIKAILSHNIEDMEKLGIYEIAPEDFAAAEYVDTSKLPLQQIVRDGLDYLRKELE